MNHQAGSDRRCRVLSLFAGVCVFASAGWAVDLCYVEEVGDSCDKVPIMTGPHQCPPVVLSSGACGSTSTTAVGSGHTRETRTSVGCQIQTRKPTINGGCMDDIIINYTANCKWEDVNADSCVNAPV